MRACVRVRKVRGVVVVASAARKTWRRARGAQSARRARNVAPQTFYNHDAFLLIIFHVLIFHFYSFFITPLLLLFTPFYFYFYF